jgi:hypothetical protein
MIKAHKMLDQIGVSTKNSLDEGTSKITLDKNRKKEKPPTIGIDASGEPSNGMEEEENNGTGHHRVNLERLNVSS